MDLFGQTPDWATYLSPILTKYKNRKHPLAYENLYQLVVMVILSAQDSDANINAIAPALFEIYPDMERLSVTNRDALLPNISTVRNFRTKANWLIEIAQIIEKKREYSVNHECFNSLKRHWKKISQCNNAGIKSASRRHYCRFTCHSSSAKNRFDF